MSPESEKELTNQAHHRFFTNNCRWLRRSGTTRWLSWVVG